MKIIASLAALVLASASFAQTPQTRPEDNVARPVEAVHAEDMPANPGLPTLWIVGDSTARNKEDLGWGDHFAHYVDTSRLNVVNRARAGRSSRTFIKEGAWDKVVERLKPGDMVLIQMGHNDGGEVEAQPKSRGTLKGVGDETKTLNWPDGSVEVVHTYGWYLRKYISDTRSKGMMPIILAPVPHSPRQPVERGDVEKSPYVGWAEEVAKAEKAPFVHLNKLILARYAGMAPADVRAKYFTPADGTHTNSAGARLNAACVAEGLRALKDCRLKDHLLPSATEAGRKPDGD